MNSSQVDWNKHYDNQLKGLLPHQPYYIVPKKMVWLR